jgi:hypothetical protein
MRHPHNEDSMIGKKLSRGVLIVALSLGLATPSRADNPEKVLITIAATTTAAAIAVVAAVATAHHRRKKIVITGCVMAGENGMTITDEEDRNTYALSGNTAGIKPGDRVQLVGKKMKQKEADKTLVWDAKEVTRDFGVCQP